MVGSGGDGGGGDGGGQRQRHFGYWGPTLSPYVSSPGMMPCKRRPLTGSATGPSHTWPELGSRVGDWGLGGLWG